MATNHEVIRVTSVTMQLVDSRLQRQSCLLLHGGRSVRWPTGCVLS